MSVKIYFINDASGPVGSSFLWVGLGRVGTNESMRNSDATMLTDNVEEYRCFLYNYDYDDFTKLVIICCAN